MWFLEGKKKERNTRSRRKGNGMNVDGWGNGVAGHHSIGRWLQWMGRWPAAGGRPAVAPPLQFWDQFPVEDGSQNWRDGAKAGGLHPHWLESPVNTWMVGDPNRGGGGSRSWPHPVHFDFHYGPENWRGERPQLEMLNRRGWSVTEPFKPGIGTDRS